MVKIISVVNQKGGVGKTTTSVNLSAALSERGKKVLLIDLDPQGHSTEHLGVRIEKNKTVLELLNEEYTLPSLVYPSKVRNLWVLPSNLRLGQFNQNSPVGRQFSLRQALEGELENRFDYVIIDCQPSLSLLTLNALVACDKVLLPVQAEFLALDGLSQLIVTLKEIQTKLHPKLSVLGILLTMYDKRNKLSFEVKNELVKNFREEIFDGVIPRSVKLAEAPSFGKSILDYAPHSPGAKGYRNLAVEVEEKFEQEEKLNK